MSEDWQSEELEYQELMYHRTLHPWGWPDSKASNARNVYWLHGGSVMSGSALTKDHQAFWKRATGWEREWSNLAFPGLPADPLVVSDSYTAVGSHMVVGHVGWFRENVIWFAPNAGTFGIGAVGKWDFEAVVARHNPRPGYYHLSNPDGNSDMSYLLVTDVGGRVLGGLDYHDADQIESSSVTPLDLLLVVELAVSLTGTLVGKIVPTINSRVAKPIISNELRELSSQELGSYIRLREAPAVGSNVIQTLTAQELKVIRGGARSVKPPLISPAELNKPVPQIRDGMGEKLMLTREERIGVLQILNVLERFRANPGDKSVWADIGNRVVKKMEHGKYAAEGWIEIYVLEGNPGWASRIRVIFRAVPGDIEAKLLQVH